VAKNKYKQMKKEEYRISVIIGIYNCASTLPEALNSLFAQTYQKFKIIMCDDGSTDDTYKVALPYAERYDNIILLKNNVNKGLNYTLNRCLECADTEYVARMDGDDISLPTRFEKEILFLDNNPDFAIVSTSMIYFDYQGDFRRGIVKPYPTNKDFVKGTPFCHAPCMVRREAYEAVGGYSVDRRLLRVEDYHLWFKMYAMGYRGHNLSEHLYKMRDDRNAFLRRKFRYRINEVYVKYIGYKMLKMPFYSYINIFRPILVELLPLCIYKYFHRK
jgi:glycosyltransferase EpsE